MATRKPTRLFIILSSSKFCVARALSLYNSGKPLSLCWSFQSSISWCPTLHHKMMMNIFTLLLALLAYQPINGQKIDVYAQRVFRYAFNPNMFTWQHGDYGGINRYTYSYLPALKGLPDMPTWMKYKYSKRHSQGIFAIFPFLTMILQRNFCDKIILKSNSRL